MQTISIDIWTLAAVAGSLAFLALIRVIWRFRRYRLKMKLPAEDIVDSSEHVDTGSASGFSHQLILQQIDASLDGLVALIESERVRMKQLLVLYPGTATVTNPHDKDHPVVAGLQKETAPSTPSQAATTNHQDVSDPYAAIMKCLDRNMPVEQVATELGLSRAEVLLAMKMKHHQAAPGAVQRLKAVI